MTDHQLGAMRTFAGAPGSTVALALAGQQPAIIVLDVDRGPCRQGSFQPAGHGEFGPGKGGVAAATARRDGADQFGNERRPRRGDRHASLGHGALEGGKARSIADLLRQQTIALLHGALELAEAAAIARVEAGDQAIEETSSFRSWSG